MARRHLDNIILTGLAGSGKSTAGPLVAERLGFRFVDLDEAIERTTGQAIPTIFEMQGESAFRDFESRLLAETLAGSRLVLATGGGAVIRPENRATMAERGLVVRLGVRPETVVGRLRREADRDPGINRPLLQGGDPEARLVALARERAAFYETADWTIQTDQLEAGDVAQEIVRIWQRLGGSTNEDQGRSTVVAPAATVTTPGGRYPIYVGDGILDSLGSLMAANGLAGRAWILADEWAAQFHGERALLSLREAGFPAEICRIPSGEGSKDLAFAGQLFGWLAERRAERREPIVALGGGVTGDLAGFVAAAYLRGVPLVQVPTTLLAMTDSSIGGKVAVNLPAGKNLVGAFHQPRLVVSDVSTLGSLHERDRRAGWAETLKHAVIRDPALLDTLETVGDRIDSLPGAELAGIIGRSAAVKATVVSADEREDGLRMILNYGHTLGHALEAAGEYHTLLHGEAVAIGMRAAAYISQQLGLLSPTDSDRQARLIAKYRLPARAPALPRDQVLRAISIDKKVQGKRVRWILLTKPGTTVVRDNVPPELVESALSEVME